MKRDTKILSASTLAGDKVVNLKGEELGTIKELMLDVSTGRIAYAVLSFGGVLGIGDKLFAIPFEALTLVNEEKQFLLDVPKKKLESAPGFDKDSWPDMTDREWGAEIFEYYGHRPYWAA